MREIDDFIDTTIMRLSSEQGTTRSQFYVDLRDYQQRVTQNLVDQCIDTCTSRGLQAHRSGDGLFIVVDLHTCVFNSNQARTYQGALSYTRQIHGNQL
jgi:hypothetical protein